jgi:uncharacterized protein (DUF952 family)
MQEKYIYHIVTIEEWDKQKQNEYYEHDSLAQEGFIHASTHQQLDATIQRYYSNEAKVIVLKIDTEKLTTDLKYELAISVNEYFPHLYGKLNKDAIIEVSERSTNQ